MNLGWFLRAKRLAQHPPSMGRVKLFAAVLAILFLGESLKAFHLAGMSLILAGFILFNR